MSLLILLSILCVQAHYSISADLPSHPKPESNFCISDSYPKFDCYPENGANQEACEARGCCWMPSKIRSNDSDIRTTNVPACVYPNNFYSYELLHQTETSYGYLIYLQQKYKNPYPDDVNTVAVMVKFETENRIHVKFFDPDNKRYEPMYPELPEVKNASTNKNYIFDFDTSKPGFKILRKDDNTTIFDFNDLRDFIFSNQFIQISSSIPAKYVYGLGEHRANLLWDTNWTKIAIWNYDTYGPVSNANLYGSHPFYLLKENSNKFHGVFLLNSNAMEVILQPSPAITYRTIGGVLDFYFFMGPTPADVISQYTEVIGRPFMPPHWGLGFHLCRFGNPTLNATREVMERNIAAGVPLDVQWNDIDYMKNGNLFTVDHDRYKGLKEFVDELHERGMHYIPLVDPGISGSEPAGAYPPFDLGVEMDILLKNATKNIFYGKVWNAISTVWPDFTHPNASDYWTQMLTSLYSEVAFDGTWLDMNEPATFVSGSLDGCPSESNLEQPPYLPAVYAGNLIQHSICMTAQHYAGPHYDVHDMFGFSEVAMTNNALKKIRNKRPMIISRSSFSGQGKYGGHWTGDVFANFDDLKQSITDLVNFNMFGIPMVGADICGFNHNTTSDLCSRWHQLGAFYGFSRNHNADNCYDQDPVAMGELVVASTKKAFGVRYALLPYLYTLFYKAHFLGGTVARPLFFEFYNDSKTLSLDTEFLWGPALLIVPVLTEGATSVTGYFPQSIWYDYYTYESVTDNDNKGVYLEVPAPSDTIPLFIRGGYILPQQTANQTTTATRKNKIDLLVASNGNGEASGDLFWDDGDSLNTIEEKKYSLVNFSLKNGTLTSQNVNWAEEYPPNLGSVTILGVVNSVSQVTVNTQSVTFTYDVNHKYLVIKNLDISFESPLEISWN